jgi:hypothetical protein
LLPNSRGDAARRGYVHVAGAIIGFLKASDKIGGLLIFAMNLRLRGVVKATVTSFGKKTNRI